MNRGGVSADDNRLSLRFIADLIRKYNNKNIEFRTEMGKETSLLEQVGIDLECLSLM
jgi:hypothetical protein